MKVEGLALVTGASRGIGRAIAAAITDAFSQAGLSGEGAVLDVNDAQAAEALLDRIQGVHGAIAILVNNAGITRDGLAMRMKDEDWQAVLETNLGSVFRMSRLVMRPMMKARFGRIINITSVVGSSGNAGQANYAAAKAGVAGMSRALARELGSRSITVNCVAPGFIDTDMTRALSPDQVAVLQQQIPLGRFGDPNDVASAVRFLASREAGYITGVTLHVNGGMYME
jgi:3-oxoacyl-[acyl-carrier protein] reductase